MIGSFKLTPTPHLADDPTLVFLYIRGLGPNQLTPSRHALDYRQTGGRTRHSYKFAARGVESIDIAVKYRVDNFIVLKDVVVSLEPWDIGF